MAEFSRVDLWRMLGFPQGAQGISGARVFHSADADGHATEEFVLKTAHGPIQGTLFRPRDSGPHPAVLYCHAHGNRYEIGRRELAEGRPALQSPPYGPLLAERGFVVACIDMPGFGERQEEGSENALAKAALWRGETLFGAMLSDLSGLLDWLAGREDVDAARIATLGISMGATHAYWLAALDSRIAAAAHLCAFANIGGLIADEAHDLHGLYMTVPGLLARGDMGDVAALVAPRPQLVCCGEQDPLTPSLALAPALERLRAAYTDADAEDLEILVSRETGHAETPEMRDRVLAFLERLKTLTA